MSFCPWFGKNYAENLRIFLLGIVLKFSKVLCLRYPSVASHKNVGISMYACSVKKGESRPVLNAKTNSPYSLILHSHFLRMRSNHKFLQDCDRRV